MLVGFSIDDNENMIGAGALLEQLVNDNGFEPRIDLPLCLEYFDNYQTEIAHTNLSADVYYQLTNNIEYHSTDDSFVSCAVTHIVDILDGACQTIGVDPKHVHGVDIIITDESSRFVIWFKEEHIKWIQQT